MRVGGGLLGFVGDSPHSGTWENQEQSTGSELCVDKPEVESEVQ